MGKHRILLLGGTTEARALAGRLGDDPRYATLLSLAGRTLEPKPQPVETRIGGFGGKEGLARFLREGQFALLVDATHPFAARISQNAAEAAAMAGVPMFALRRPAWERQPGDDWTSVGSVAEAVGALGVAARRVFLAIGRQEAFHFEAAPQHHYLVRSVDPVTPPLALPQMEALLACGPFATADEEALLRHQRIDIIVAKNSGGAATYGKIEAARALKIPVVMVERRTPPGVTAVGSVEAAVDRVHALLSAPMKRGV